MKAMIQSGEELREWFFRVRKQNEKLAKGVFVSSKKRHFGSTDQGKIILEGRVENIKFKSLTGGVYQAFIERE